MTRILDATLCHIDEIEAIEKSCFSMPWTREQLINYLPDERHELVAALDDAGKLTGYAGLMNVLDEGYISNVAVRADCRRRGTAQALIKALIDRAERKELAFLTLEVRESNLAARSLYKKLGFLDVGVRKNYYSKPTENAILMTLFLKVGADDEHTGI